MLGLNKNINVFFSNISFHKMRACDTFRADMNAEKMRLDFRGSLQLFNSTVWPEVETLGR